MIRIRRRALRFDDAIAKYRARCKRKSALEREGGATIQKRSAAGQWNHAVEPDIDAVGLERAVRLLGRRIDADGGARLERARVAHLILDDRRARGDQDLLLAALVLDHQGQAVDAGHRIAGLAVGHGAVGRARPAVAVPVAGAALQLREDVDLDRLLGAVGLRHRAAADVGAGLDVGHRGLGDAHDQRLVGERHGLPRRLSPSPAASCR